MLSSGASWVNVPLPIFSNVPDPVIRIEEEMSSDRSNATPPLLVITCPLMLMLPVVPPAPIFKVPPDTVAVPVPTVSVRLTTNVPPVAVPSVCFTKFSPLNVRSLSI